MRILHGAAIGKELRNLSDNAKHRVWIASPYIGRWPAVSALLGGNWWLSSTILLQVLTDVEKPTNVNRGTLMQLLNRGPVRSLPGMHAKIYIVDDQAIVTSANLTETAFTKRREIGILLDASESKDAVEVFASWWEKLAANVSPQHAEKMEGSSGFEAETEEGNALPILWSLPQKPANDLFVSSGTAAQNFASYRIFLQHYKEFAKEYESVQRLWPDDPLFIETDTFLNFLFHEAEGRPSFAFHETRNPRKMSDLERRKELSRWAPIFAEWLRTAPDETYRVRNAELVRTLLAKDRIDDLTHDEIRQVVDCFHCMNAQQLIRYKFLNPANNSVEVVRNAWKVLLFGDGKVEQRMKYCDDSLKFFSTSSVQELLGWYDPDRYPIRNSNSDAGLRFFGYSV